MDTCIHPRFREVELEDGERTEEEKEEGSEGKTWTETDGERDDMGALEDGKELRKGMRRKRARGAGQRLGGGKARGGEGVKLFCLMAAGTRCLSLALKGGG